MTNNKDVSNVGEALEFIADFASYDGGHHKQWVIDQVVRILTNCEIKDNKRIPSEEYEMWVKNYCYGYGEDYLYEWDEGIAP
jgi:hypothetical protein